MEAASSGRLVPSATTVRPMISSLTPSETAMPLAPQTSSLELADQYHQAQNKPADGGRHLHFVHQFLALVLLASVVRRMFAMLVNQPIRLQQA